jgi:hypothetical protein
VAKIFQASSPIQYLDRKPSMFPWKNTVAWDIPTIGKLEFVITTFEEDFHVDEEQMQEVEFYFWVAGGYVSFMSDESI